MTRQYKTGVWYAHNGEPSPVHPNTVVKGVDANGMTFEREAELVDWLAFEGAFQIVTHYVEPREFIVTIAPNGDLSVHHCDNPPSVHHEGCEYINVVEKM